MCQYCPTASNPADLLTRGVTLQQLKTSSIWISGPSWLTVLHLVEISAKAAPARLPLVIDVSTVMKINRFKWSSLRRTTALLFCQLRNFRLKKEWIRSLLTAKELLHAELQWIRSFQFHFLSAELEYLRGDKNRRRPPLVTQLDLYLDENLVIRCRGRLLNADISRAAQNPVLLPKNTDLTRLIIRYYHERSLHSGISIAICHIRRRFWIPSIRPQVKAIVLLYTTCRRVNGPPYRAPNPAKLPSFRVRGDKAFAVTGIDFAGPFPIRAILTSKSQRQDLTTANFLLAFQSFNSHHFQPRIVISDNATTFEWDITCNKRPELRVKIGDVVLVHNEGPRIDWKLAVVEELIASPDG
ncbi:uncharacterized protein LOC116928660 [Daphnia magna]|uniref:uncharacterized protein LOC116928660 n=1 Tax=Daphnia magna TaxID=35525 RepID=UPI001E1BBB08|nr:uncharacterized protein LOC116928660 [Daphnia magna]